MLKRSEQLRYLLNREQIDKILDVFDEMRRNWKARALVNRDKHSICGICSSDLCRKVNDLLLQGAARQSIRTTFPCSLNLLDRHFNDHLQIAIGVVFGNHEWRKTGSANLFVKADELCSQEFPAKSGVKKQLQWCLMQFVALKEIESDMLFRRVLPTKTVDGSKLEKQIMRIRETIMLIDGLDKKRKGKAGQAPTDYGDADDWLTDQQKAEMKKLDEMQQEKAKRTLERMIKDATSGNGEARKGSEASEDDASGNAPS